VTGVSDGRCATRLSMAGLPLTRPLRWAAGLLVGVLLAACGAESDALPEVGARLDETTVSGISSGAYMAGQFQMAHASIVVGAGIIAGGPYGCAESLFADVMPGPGTVFLNASKAINGCMRDGLRILDIPNPENLARRAQSLAENGRIDPVAEVRDDRVYLFSGTRDSVVVPSIVAAAEAYYLALGVRAEAISHVSELPAGHGFVTTDFGEACAYTGAPYVVDCDYDMAAAMLGHLLGPLEPPGTAKNAEFRVFDQRPFTRGLTGHGLASEGVVYVPGSCRAAPGCRVHIAFHGCAQSREMVGDAFVAGSGLWKWADTNRLVVLFPQVGTSPLNPQGCWDWWGYSSRAYLTQAAPQITAVRRMLDRLAGGREAS